MLVLKLNAVSDECGVMEAPSFTIYRNDVWIQKPWLRHCEDSQVSIIQRHVRCRLFLDESMASSSWVEFISGDRSKEGDFLSYSTHEPTSPPWA